jgi:hypothetical protein
LTIRSTSRLEAAAQHLLLPSGIDQLTRSQVIDIFIGRYRKLPLQGDRHPD